MMRNAVLVVTALVVTAPFGHAESWAENLFKDGLKHDFGNVPRGAELYHRFIVTNIYAVPLQLTSVHTSCTLCSKVSVSTEPIKPKETGWVDIVMDTRKFSGLKAITIDVSVGPTFTSSTQLRVSANCRTDIVCNPGSVNFGVVGVGSKPTHTIDVEYAGNLPWKVTGLSTNDGPFEATYKELYRRPGQVGYQIAVTLKADAAVGQLKHELLLETNDPASKQVPVIVEAILQGSLGVVPEKLALGAVKVGDELPRRIVVRGAKPFKITAIDGLGDGVELAGPMPTAATATHSITFKIKVDKEGELKRVLQIKTDLQEKPLTLAIEAVVSPQ
jgi:hypothetical protein